MMFSRPSTSRLLIPAGAAGDSYCSVEVPFSRTARRFGGFVTLHGVRLVV